MLLCPIGSSCSLLGHGVSHLLEHWFSLRPGTSAAILAQLVVPKVSYRRSKLIFLFYRPSTANSSCGLLRHVMPLVVALDLVSAWNVRSNLRSPAESERASLQ
jgi:hypothetical protein